MSCVITSFAETQSKYENLSYNGEKALITMIDNNTAKVIENGQVSEIKIKEISKNITRVTVSELGKESLVLTSNSIEGTVTTSDGTIIKVDESFQNDLLNNSSLYKDEMFVFAARSTITKVEKKYSYAKIKKSLSEAVTIAAIAGVLVTFLAASGIAIPGLLALIIDCLNASLGVIAMTMRGESDKGLAVILNKIQNTAHHGNETGGVTASWSFNSLYKY